MKKQTIWFLPIAFLVAADFQLRASFVEAADACDDRIVFAVPFTDPDQSYTCQVARESAPSDPLGTFTLRFGDPSVSGGVERFQAVAVGAAPFNQDDFAGLVGAAMICSCQPKGLTPTTNAGKAKFNESVEFSCVGQGGGRDGRFDGNVKTIVGIEGEVAEDKIDKGKAITRRPSNSIQDGETYIYACTAPS